MAYQLAPCNGVVVLTLCSSLQVFRSNLWIGFSVCISCISPHDHPETAGDAEVEDSNFPQFTNLTGCGQPGGSVFHVEVAS